jgi:Lecithin:cholesterol acyltransferase
MAKSRIRDMVILLPGITGSVLQKNGVDVWAPSGKALANTLFSLGRSLQDLRLGEDDVDVDDLKDGVRATRLMPDAHLVPGLVKIDGYSSISRLVIDRFHVVPGHPDQDTPANFFEFPYDWRRNNIVAARKLKRLIDKHLPKWQEYSGANDAKVILVAHSMGGLVSRYYLECMEGWHDCRALVTFGTPYRGSVNALRFLANGYKKAFVDLTDVLGSCTAVYQLLPIYRMVSMRGDWVRVAEAGPIPGVDSEACKAALKFHRAIEAAVKERERVGGGYPIIPYVGLNQPTLQSARLVDGKIEISEQMPEWIDPGLQDGDGTVPHLSAIPIELSDAFRETFVSGRHASLQCIDRILSDLYRRIQQMQIRGLESIRAPEARPDLMKQPALSVELDDLYVAGEPVTVRASLLNSDEPVGGVFARVKPVDPPGRVRDYNLLRSAERGWHVEIGDCAPGLYRLEVRTRISGPRAPLPIQDLFVVSL